jgi:lipopolysaccharide export system permease protein
MTVMVFTFVLLLGNALKEILPLLVSGQVRLVLVAKAIGLLIPFVWVFALPMGMLTATLLIFGRFSADQELTAVRASGLSLLSLVGPILLLSLVLCGVSAVVNMELGPRCRVAYTSLLSSLRVEFSSAKLPEGRFVKDFPGYIFYVGKNRKDGDLQDIMIFVLHNETNILRTLRAPRARMVVEQANKRLSLTLYDARVIELGADHETSAISEEMSMDFDLEPPKKQGPKIDDMTFTQLMAELRDLERRLQLPLSLKALTPEQRAARQREWLQRRKEGITPILFHLHRQVASAFACFGFALVGIPLGIRVHRRETNIGIALGLVLAALYYSFILVGQALNTRPEFAPHVLVWIPNFLFQGIGTVLLWRANRGG